MFFLLFHFIFMRRQSNYFFSTFLRLYYSFFKVFTQHNDLFNEMNISTRQYHLLTAVCIETKNHCLCKKIEVREFWHQDTDFSFCPFRDPTILHNHFGKSRLAAKVPSFCFIFFTVPKNQL